MSRPSQIERERRPVAEKGSTRAVAQAAPAWIGNCVDHWGVGLVLLLGILGFVGYQGMLPIRNPDFGWHVALGRWMVEHHAIPATEPFTHTAAGKPVVMAEWLSEILFYLVVRAGGYLTLRWVHAGIVVAIVAIVFAWLRYEQVPAALAALGALTYVAVTQPRFQHRPLMLDLLAQVIMYGYVFVRRPALTRRQLAAIALATVVWVNLHAGATIFPALVVLYTVVEALQQWLGWRRPEPTDLGAGNLRRLATLAGLVSLAVFVSPNHLRLIPYIFATQEMNSGRSLEWVPMTRMWGHPSMTPFAVESFWVLLAATAAIALLTLRRQSLAQLAVVVFLAVLPLNGERFVSAYYGPVLFVFGALGGWLRARAGRPAAALVSVAAIGLVIVGTYPIMNYQGELQRYPGRFTSAWDFQPETFPIGAVRFLGEVNLTGKLFNPSDWGGYVLQKLYTQYPIFIDGRWVEVGKGVFEASSAITDLRPDAFEQLDAYDIDLVLMPREWMPKPRIVEREWLPVFENSNAGVYVRNTPRNAENLRRCAAYYATLGIPFSVESGFNERQAFEANANWAGDFGLVFH